MRWFKAAVIAASVLAVFLVVSSVIGYLIEATIAAIIVVGIYFGVKATVRNKQVPGKWNDREVRNPAYGSSRRRHKTLDVDEDLARLKREMGG
jgi:hypothetical protein